MQLEGHSAVTSKRRGGGRQISSRLRLDLLMPGPGEVAAARIVVLAIANGGGYDEVLAALQAAIGRRQLDPRVQAALKKAFDGLQVEPGSGSIRGPATTAPRNNQGRDNQDRDIQRNDHRARVAVPRDGGIATSPAPTPPISPPASSTPSSPAEAGHPAGRNGAMDVSAATGSDAFPGPQTAQQQQLEPALKLHAADGGQVHLTSRPFKPRQSPTEY